MDLQLDFCQNLHDFGKMHLEVYKITNITKYRDFQYRLYQRGIITNIQLQKWGIKDSKECTFCRMQEETLTHLFFNCPYVHKIWEELYKYLTERFETSESQIQIAVPNVILNRIVEKQTHAINFICLVTKQYIYKQRCMGKELSFNELKQIITKMERIEKIHCD